MKHKNGDWVWVLDRGRVMEWDKERNPVRMVGTHQDINQRKQAEKKLHEERDKLKRLHDAVDELQRQDTEDEVVETAVEVAETMLDFEFCVIDILEGDYLVPKANSAGLDSEKTTTFKIDEGIAGETVQKGETIWSNDVREHPDAKPTKEEWRAFISVPIGDIGNLQVISKEVASFDEEEWNWQRCLPATSEKR